MAWGMKRKWLRKCQVSGETAVKDNFRGTRSQFGAAFLPVEKALSFRYFEDRLSSKYLKLRHKLVDPQFCLQERTPQLSFLRLIIGLHWWLTLDGARDVYVPSWLLSSMWIPHHQTDRPSGKIIEVHGLDLLHLMLQEAECTNLTPLSSGNDVKPLVNILNLCFSALLHSLSLSSHFKF